MSVGITCVKIITLSWNLLIGLTGLMILFIGITVQLNYSHYSNFVSDTPWTAPMVLIVVGAVLALVCFLGCCGTLKENSCMIVSFVLLGILAFLFEIGLGIAGYMKHIGLRQAMEAQFNNTMLEYNERKDYRDAWSLLQSELNCCGTYGAADWEGILPNKTLPSSCCAVINLNEAERCTVVHANADGCFSKLLAIFDSNTTLLSGMVVAVIATQVITILLACCLYRSFRRR